MLSPLSFRLSETVIELLVAGSYRRSVTGAAAAPPLPLLPKTTASLNPLLGPPFLPPLMKPIGVARRLLPLYLVLLEDALLRVWLPKTAARTGAFLLFMPGIVYRELLCCMSPSEPPFHCCRLCSEQFVVASIVVVAAARFCDVNVLGSRSGCCTLVNLSYCCGCGYHGAAVAAVTNVGPRGKEFR
ncbi:uncharacterized protein DS421_13g409760 [Arachis hypogaea]|nr:uncharacterized protein DS421_13g409760 [Arachis hypogaea]